LGFSGDENDGNNHKINERAMNGKEPRNFLFVFFREAFIGKVFFRSA
jgi:hypothetical protein